MNPPSLLYSAISFSPPFYTVNNSSKQQREEEKVSFSLPSKFGLKFAQDRLISCLILSRDKMRHRVQVTEISLCVENMGEIIVSWIFVA